jgi:3-deoxy-D-arabino-heptulosonate 7-phosphate (DAHP) synthase
MSPGRTNARDSDDSLSDDVLPWDAVERCLSRDEHLAEAAIPDSLQYNHSLTIASSLQITSSDLAIASGPCSSHVWTAAERVAQRFSQAVHDVPHGLRTRMVRALA